MTEDCTISDFVLFDGGPMIVLQGDAVPLWQGAIGWGEAKPNDNTVKTDYDVICDISYAGEHVTERHGYDMLVLDDSEWETCFVVFASGEIAVFQCFEWSEEPIPETIKRLCLNTDVREYVFDVRSSMLQLLPGAFAGTDEHEYQEVAVTPGQKRCTIYESDEALLLLIADAEVAG